MNCKQGDLAVIVHSDFFKENIGKIVTCVEFKAGPDGSPAWVIDRALFEGTRRTHNKSFAGDWVCDKVLRPIRDQPGEDETLRIAGLPNKQPEVA